MGKVTLYDLGGDVYRELDCIKVEPWIGHMSRLVTEDGENILTDLPVVAVDVPILSEGPDGYEQGNTFDVELVLGGGSTRFRRKWTGACRLVKMGHDGFYGFWHGGKSVYVVGPVVIDNFGGPNPLLPNVRKREPV
jgi:hypothetical protein